MRRRPTRIFETIEAALTGVSRGPGIALAVALVVGAGDARSAVTFYTDAASWQAAAEAVVGSPEPFDTTAPNVGLANEVSPDTVTNKGLCGFPPVTPSPLTFADETEGGGKFFDALSIGDINDFEFSIPDGVLAFGFYRVDNSQDVSESFTVYDGGDVLIGTKPGLEIPTGSPDPFLGFVSDDLLTPDSKLVQTLASAEDFFSGTGETPTWIDGALGVPPVSYGSDVPREMSGRQFSSTPGVCVSVSRCLKSKE